MTQLFITKAHRATQSAINDLWYRHYSTPMSQDDRNRLVEAFADEWLVDPAFNPAEAFILHPATSKRDWTRVTVTDVLTDFIMRALQSDEKAAEYPVENPDRQADGKAARRDSELSLVSDNHLDEETAGEIIRDDYSVLESELVDSYTPRVTSVESYTRQLEDVKEFAPYYAQTYAEERGEPVSEVLRRIGRLDIGRLRRCTECGNGFYAHDLRRRVCDQQIGIGTDLSACEKLAKNRADLSGYYERQKEGVEKIANI